MSKFLDYTGLQHYHEKVQGEINQLGLKATASIDRFLVDIPFGEKKGYVNLAAATVGEAYTMVVDGAASYTYIDIPVVAGDTFIITTKGVTAKAKSYAILDSQNVVLAVYQPALTNVTIQMPNNAARLIVNSQVNAASFVHQYNGALVDGLRFLDFSSNTKDNLFSLHKGSFVDMGSIAVGETYDIKIVDTGTYSYEIVQVAPGDKFTITTKTNTASAKAYAILDAQNVVLAFQQRALTDEILIMPDNAALLIVNSAYAGASMTRDLGKIDELLKDNNIYQGIVKRHLEILNGSVPNTSSTVYVRTPAIRLDGAKYLVVNTDRPVDDGYEYQFGYALTSDASDINSRNGSQQWAGHIMHVDVGAIGTETVIDVTNYPQAVGIAFTIGERLKGGTTWKSLRLTDFIGYSLVLTQCPDLEKKIAYMMSGNDIVQRNKEREIPLLATCRDQKLTASPYKDIQFLICTDSHADNVAVNNAISATNGFDSIDGFIHCGDITGSASNESGVITNFQQALDRLEKPGYVVVGNHDVGNSYYVGRCFSHAQAYTAFIKQMVDKGWLASGEYTANLPYWYHDNATYKVRLIGIYEYDDALDLFDSTYWEPVTYDSSATEFAFSHSYAVGDIVKCGTYTDNCFRCKSAVTTPANYYTDIDKLPRYIIRRGDRVIRETQANWFLNTLASTPAGYGVIVLMHNPFSDAAETYECKFSQHHGVLGSQYSQNDMATDFIADAVAAFKNGTSYSANVAMKGDAAYLNTQGGGTYAYSVSKDFSSKNAGAHLLGIFGGHSHRDLVFKKGTLYQITPVCAVTERGNSMNSDIRRTQEDGLCKDSLTVASFSANRIALCKIGVNVTDTGKARDFEVLNTAQ